jgi:hypothetical protein
MDDDHGSVLAIPASDELIPYTGHKSPVRPFSNEPLPQLEPRHIDWINRCVSGGADNIQDIYPLTPLQEGMLFSRELNNKHKDMHTLSTLLQLQSRVQLQVFIGALQNSINRHDAFRTAVFWQQLPQPIQVVYRRAHLQVAELACPGALEDLRRRATSPREWNLQQAPLIRLEVACDAFKDECYVLLSVHHIICDHISLKVLVSELVAQLSGCGGNLPEPVPYRAHVFQALANSNTPEAQAYFREKLNDVVETTAPFGLRDVRGDSAVVVEHRCGVAPTLSKRVRFEAQRLDVSAARLFHAAWSLLVARLSGRTDVVLGTVLGTRADNLNVKQAIGLFINTLPLRLHLEKTTAIELVRQVQYRLSELLKYRYASLAVAQSCSSTDRLAPLFSSLLNCRRAPPVASDWSSVDIRVLSEGEAHTNYPLALTIDDHGEEFVLTAQSDGRIDPVRITEYMHVVLQSLIQALEQAPDTPAVSLGVLPAGDREKLTKGFNSTSVPYPCDKFLHELFEAQASRAPDSTAVELEREFLTYAALNSRANQLARYLKRKGVGPDCLVGIYVDRTLDMVVGLLGILKAGGAYIPLDRTYPVERLRFMLEEARLRWLVTEERLKLVLPAFAGEVCSTATGRASRSFLPAISKRESSG